MLSVGSIPISIVDRMTVIHKSNQKRKDIKNFMYQFYHLSICQIYLDALYTGLSFLKINYNLLLFTTLLVRPIYGTVDVLYMKREVNS